MPTEEQMTASLIEAKDVTIAELRKERDALDLRCAVLDACYALSTSSLDAAKDTLDHATRVVQNELRNLTLAFIAGIALAALVAGVW